MTDTEQVTIEFYGVPRWRAGRAELAVPAGTVTTVLAAIERDCPGLRGLMRNDGRLAPHYLLSINGERFLTDMEQLNAGDRVLLLSADAGG